MHITKWGDSGIICAVYIAEHADDCAVGASKIADALHIDLQYLHQVLHRLLNGGIVTSIRGPKGGYKLARPAEQISLRQILEATEGSTFELFCDKAPLSQELCSTEVSCALRDVWKDLGKAINEILENRSLASLMKGSGTNDSNQNANPALVQIHSARLQS